MKITFKGDYALKAILDLSMIRKTAKSYRSTISPEDRIFPLPFLEQIMLILKKAGYVQSRTGKGGGFYLSKRPEDITMGEIVRLIEGPIEPIACGVRGSRPVRRGRTLCVQGGLGECDRSDFRHCGYGHLCPHHAADP